jgi:hypothetical protein
MEKICRITNAAAANSINAGITSKKEQLQNEEYTSPQ